MLHRRKIALPAGRRAPSALGTVLCRMMMLVVACVWCLGGFTPDRVWAAETPVQSSPDSTSSSEQKTTPSSSTTASTSEDEEGYSFFRPSPDWDWRFFPTPQEIQRYRKSWNPFSHGPILANSPDVQPKKQILVQLYVFSEVGNDEFRSNGLQAFNSSEPSTVKLRAVAPTWFIGYGITDNMEIDVAPQLLWYNSFAGDAGPNVQPLSGKALGQSHRNDIGLGDTTIYLKTRHRVQDPTSWKGTFTTYHGISLPTSQWFGTDTFGTHPIPGGFAPLGRLPATKFGGLSLTEGVMWRKNIEPFRFMGSVYYTYTIPGSTAGHTTYNGDIINTRAIAEWIVDDKRGLGFSLEFLSVHGLSWRADGHSLDNKLVSTVKPVNYHLIGIEPSIQYTLFHGPGGSLVAAAGCLFTLAGQNDIDAIYPNMSIYYYWAKKGTPVMR